MYMTYLHSIILGIVEGITEFLPISSTAHLEIVSKLFGLIQTDFLKSFEIIIQLGAILAVVVLYAGRVKGNLEIWKRVIAASLRELESLSYPKAIAIGTVQALAVTPGISRSAATVVAGMSLGLRRTAIVEFSFLLAIPTMLAASGYDVYKNASTFSSSQFGILAIVR